MNFIDSIILSKSSKSSEVDIMGTGKLNVPKISDNIQDGENVKIGIRPEHITLNDKSSALWESKVFVVEKGLRIAQMVLSPVIKAILKEVKELEFTKRGSGGFGSTGIK